MTPLDELERLLELSKEGEFPSERYRAMKNFERLLGNHAEALIKVARAADKYRNALTSFTEGIYGGELDRALARLKEGKG